MRAIEVMIMQRRWAKHLAGRAVKVMIKRGCSPVVMRNHDIPVGVYHLALGRAMRGIADDPFSLATEEMKFTREDYLFDNDKAHQREASDAATGYKSVADTE